MSTQYQGLAIDSHPPLAELNRDPYSPPSHTPFPQRPFFTVDDNSSGTKTDHDTYSQQPYTLFPRPFSISSPIVIDEHTSLTEPDWDPYAPASHTPVAHSSLISSTFPVDDNSPCTKPEHDAYYPPRHASSSHSFSMSPVFGMLASFMTGCAIAITHHFYYHYLDGKPIDSTYISPFHNLDDQKWAGHFGAALAFAAKFLLAQAVGVAYVQRLWAAARRTRGLSLDGLDAGFDILTNPMGFLCWDFISSAQRLILLALMSWAMPLIAIITPGALLVVSQNITTPIHKCVVPSVDLSTSNSSDFLSLYTTDSNGNSYLASPSPPMQQLATLALLSGTYKAPDPPCGPVCIYNTSFFAPYFDCTKPQNIGNRSESPDGYVYFWNATSVVDSADTPDQLYIEWYGDRQDDQAQRVVCSAVNATYTFYIRHNGSECLIISQSVTPMNNFSTIYNATYGMSKKPDNPGATVYAAIFQAVTTILGGTVINGSAVPADSLQSRETMPSPMASSPQVGNSPSPFFSLRINQTMVTMGNFGIMDESTREWIPSSYIGQLVESLMYNISIGLAALTIPGSSSNPNSSTFDKTCKQIATKNIYSYHPIVLWVPYSLASTCTLFSVLVGMHALWSNQSGGTTGFKATMAATRNPDLDAVVSGRVGKNGKEIRLRFVDFGADGKPRKMFEVEPDSVTGAAIY